MVHHEVFITNLEKMEKINVEHLKWIKNRLAAQHTFTKATAEQVCSGHTGSVVVLMLF